MHVNVTGRRQDVVLKENHSEIHGLIYLEVWMRLGVYRYSAIINKTNYFENSYTAVTTLLIR
jgi:hypothetical protein